VKIHNLIQGSPQWLAYRAQHFNASDAPAMMGVSPYKSRAEEPRRTSTPEHWTEPEIAGMRQRAAAERADQMGVYPEEAVEAAMRVIHPHSEHADCGESFCMAIATGILLGRIRADKFVGDV
jgi:hypothetical protein